MLVVLGARIGAIALPKAPPRERALFGAIGVLAIVNLLVRALGVGSALSEWPLLGGVALVTVVACLARRERRLGLDVRRLFDRENAPLALVAAGALGVAGYAAYVLPIWQWDSLGYHLPYVNFALEGRGFSAMPEGMPYVTDYPHVIENLYVLWRAVLPDDRLVDAAQIPLGLLGAAAVAVLARRFGARAEHAVAAGLAWITLPAVFLQLPTDYVDVGAAALLLASAAFVLGDMAPASVVAGGVAIGLFLGSKPNAPVGATLLFAVLAVRGWRAGRRGALVIAAGVAFVLGAGSYVTNWIEHGNPTWPVRLTIGPIEFPGELPMSALLLSGCAAPRLAGALPVRVARSWLSLDAPPVFDMRYGGLGLVFLIALPIAIVIAVRRRSIPLAVVALAALASPDPAVPRYILAFPGLVLALASAPLARASRLVRHAALAIAAVAAAIALVRAAPGLAGDGPPLSAYAAMTEDERLRAVGADGSPRAFHDALRSLPDGATSGFDASLELPYLAWSSDLRTRAIHLPEGLSEDEASRLVGERDLALLIVDDASAFARVARRPDSPYREVFRCRTTPPPMCMVVAANGRPIPSCVGFVRR